jgi:hypothetical protein
MSPSHNVLQSKVPVRQNHVPIQFEHSNQLFLNLKLIFASELSANHPLTSL